MNSKNTKLTILSVLLILVISLAALTGCDGGSVSGSISEIFVVNTDVPRTTYVVGQSLDLTGGKLSVVIDGQKSYVPMTNEGVSVTGYDPNTLGKQTLTLTYQGHTATFDVTVVQRAVAENVETNYFKGDSLDTSKGRLRITRDDGTSFTVNLKDSKVSVKSFPNGSTGKATAVVTYSGELVCDCSFEVTFHEAADVKYTAPKENQYLSHQTELNLTGGYFEVKAASPSTFSKFVNITQAMVSGYEPEKVTYENRNEAVTQTIKISYLGHEFNFDVHVTYSPVYLVSDVAKLCADLDWTGDRTPDISKELGTEALSAIVKYLDLLSSDQALVKHDDLVNVVRPATIHLTSLYREASGAFSDAFIITSDGMLDLVAKSYSDIENAIAKLRDPEDMFNYYAALLVDFIDLFGEEELLPGAKLSDVIMTHTPESIERITPMFEHMLDIYDLLKEIPDDWTVETLKSCDLQITTAAARISVSDFVGIGYNQIYEAVSSWRKNDDYFRIIYSHYLYNRANGRNEILDGLWGKVPAPGILNDWYTSYTTALAHEYNMAAGMENSNSYLYDTTQFMYNYFKTLELAEQLKDEGDALCLALYELKDCDKLTKDNLTYGPCGYVYNMGKALDSDRVKDIWNTYLLMLAETEAGTMDDEAYKAVAATLVNKMSKLSPAELNAFVSSLNFMYDTADGDILVLDTTQYYFSSLTNFISDYAAIALGEDGYALYNTLMMAMESYALNGIKDSAMSDFKAHMESLMGTYGKLPAETQNAFYGMFGEAYDRYVALYSNSQASDILIPADFADIFADLDTTLQNFEKIVAYIDSASTVEAKSQATPLLFALYEKAAKLHGEISASGNPQALSALHLKSYTKDGTSYTLDLKMAAVAKLMSGLMASSLSGQDGTVTVVWDIYGNTGIGAFLAEAADMMLAEHNATVYTGDITSALKLFRELSNDDRTAAYMLGINQLYYNAVIRCAPGASKTVSSLIQAEISYTLYMADASDADLNNFVAHMESAMNAYKDIADKEAFEEAFGEHYAYYTDLYNSLKK